MDRQSLLTKLEKQIQDCKKCGLWEGTIQAVPGEGNPEADIFFIGEGPGFHEDKLGRPFVGRAGKLLDKLIELVGLTRDSVYIGNVIKHRPPENRDPSASEISACNYWLDQQLEIIKPKVVVTLGRFSMAKFLPNVKISEVHGNPARVKNLVVVPMYHPAAALRRGEILNRIKDDFQKNKDLFQNPSNVTGINDSSPEGENPNQTSLF